MPWPGIGLYYSGLLRFIGCSGYADVLFLVTQLGVFGSVDLALQLPGEKSPGIVAVAPRSENEHGMRAINRGFFVSTIAFGYGAPGLQAGNFLVLFGALDRLGGFFVLASIREFAPFVTAIILAGVAGTAITADLGARKIREELDALQVLGVDPIKNLVVPRFLALMIVTGLFNIYALIFGIFGGVLATLTFDAPLGPFFATLLTNASTTDLWGSVVKTTLFGAIIAIVSCYKGMTASGGAEGVGRAVNQAVVISFLGIFAFNYVFTQTLLATHPEISVIK